jgi:hypothetical protein
MVQDRMAESGHSGALDNSDIGVLCGICGISVPGGRPDVGSGEVDILE